MALATACGGGAAGVDGGGADARGLDAPGIDALVTSVTLTGRVEDYVSQMPLGDVVIAVDGHPEVPSVTSDASGKYVLPGVPAFTTVTLTFSKASYMPQISRPLAIGGSDVLMYGGRAFDAMATRAIVNFITSNFGETYDPSLGAMVMRVEDSQSLMGLVGATSSLGGGTSGKPVVYFNDKSFPDQTLTATTSSGLVLFHAYQPSTGAILSIDDAARPHCSGEGPDLPPLPLTLEIRADTITWLPVQCGP